ncbi:MAG TPA: tetratricopeptide repeat protein [Thermohalobaculum sp.]|nr:tetratricopeptide repeat protein [Thermohalobaculum sp.]
MSETDSFIQEVTEEVRQDRMFRLWKKYGPYVLSTVAVIVAASAGLNWYNHYQEQVARAAGGAVLATDLDSVSDQETLIETLDGPAKTIARMRLAAAKAAEGDAPGAAEAYRAIAAEPGLGRAYADLARLEAVRVALGVMDPQEAIAELEPLTAADGPYRLLALELRAALRLNSGAVEAGHADLIAILEDAAATRSLRERASVMLISSGGQIPQVTQ